jgi:O-antigen ligase
MRKTLDTARDVAATTLLAIAAAVVVAWVTVSVGWYLAAAMLLVIPLVILANREPMIAIWVWLVVMPFVVQTDSGATRKVFWVVHRLMPLGMVVMLFVTASAVVATRKLAKLGLPELLMAGYVVVSVLSIAYTSDAPTATVYSLYDRVVAPMCLYLIIRLSAPTDREMARTWPIVFLLLTQVFIAMLSWSAPGALPDAWLGKVGERTVGSLRAPDVFGTTMVFCAMYLLHAGMCARAPAARVRGALLFCLALLMAFLTFSRASWLAAGIALVGAVIIYRGFARQLLVVMLIAVPIVITSGVLQAQLDFARARLSSQESEYTALSRLPVMYAAVRMFEDKPMLGFGYANFERYDRAYQQRVGNIVYPDEKNLSSHNLYLTTLAEQGIIGIALLLGPAAVWLRRTLVRVKRLPRSGFASQRLVASLWIVMLAHVTVNNFSRMQSPFGFGIWWITLGLIATIVDRARTTEPATIQDRSVGIR